MAEGSEGAILETAGTLTVAPTTPVESAQEGGKVYSQEYVEALRREAAGYRTQLRSTEATLKEVQASTASAEELKGRLSTLEAEIAAKAAEAEAARLDATLTKLAVAVGIDPDIAALIDKSKIDFTDEEKAKATLAKLAGAGRTSQGQVKPGAVGNTGMTESELRDWAFGSGGRKTTIFGG